MKTFIDKIKNNEFVISKCSYCYKLVWPPLSYCDICYHETSLVKHTRRGRIIEYSISHYTNDEVFALVDLDGIILIGKILSDDIYDGMKVYLEVCGIDSNQNVFFDFVKLKEQRLD